jgi:hypothetical protein
MIKSNRMSWVGEMRNAYNMLVGKPEGKRPPERSRRRWEENIKMDLGERVWLGSM